MGLSSIIKGVLSAVSDNQAAAPVSYASIEDTLKQFFAEYNCKFELEADDEEKSRGFNRYFFDFQGGHYVANTFHESGVEIVFPRIVDVPARYLDIVRATCNRCNSNDSCYKYSYVAREEQAEIGVHISYFAEVATVESLHKAISEFFQAQREFNECLKNAVENGRRDHTLDVERVYSERKRELFLIRNQEIQHGQTIADTFFSEGKQLTLGSLVKDLLDRKDIKFTRLQVMDDKTMTDMKEDETDLEKVSLTSFIVDDSGEEPSYRSSVVTMAATYKTPLSESPDDTYVLTISMREAGIADRTLFYRVTLAFDQGDASMRNSILATSTDNKTPLSHSLLVGYDFSSSDQLRAEADYMWKDALIKVSENKNEELSDEQEMLMDVTCSNNAYNLYWGRHYMLNNRYYEAIAHFENVYRRTRKSFFTSSKEATKQFMQMLYYLGFCYCELGLYEKAFYYLNIVRTTGNIHHVMEYVNVLANSGDIRVFKEIETIAEDVHQQFTDDEDIPEHVQNLLSFLKRRRAFSLIEFGEFDEAEKAYKALLDDPESHDYALNELAYLQQLKSGAAPNEGDSQPESEAGDVFPQDDGEVDSDLPL